MILLSSMSYKHLVFLCHIIIIITSFIKRNGVESCRDGPREDGLCCTSFYVDGDICEECLPGYYGDNCSLPCPLPNYGPGCNLECTSCTNCNHVYGCTQTTDNDSSTTKRKTRSKTLNFTSSLHTSSIFEKESSSMKAATGNKTSDFDVVIIIYTSGTLVSIVIILIIVREICNCCKILPLPTKNEEGHVNYVDENVYSEVSDVKHSVILHKEREIKGLKEVSCNGHASCDDNFYNTVCEGKEQSRFSLENLEEQQAESQYCKSEEVGILCIKQETINLKYDCHDRREEFIFNISTSDIDKAEIRPEFCNRRETVNICGITQHSNSTIALCVLVNEETETTYF